MIRLFCVGKLKERHYLDAAGEYLRRLGRYVKTETLEFREFEDKNPEVSKRREAEPILAKLAKTPNTYVVALDQGGRQYISEDFSQLLRKPDLTFIVGGPVGLSHELLEKSDLVLSLSKMTLPHQLARVFLLEQIYRGHTILKGEKYHK